MREKHIKENFCGTKLAGRDLSGQDYLECSFRGVKMHGTDLSKCNLYKSDFQDADLNGMIVSLNCFTFKDIVLDHKQVKLFLYLIQLAEIDLDLKCQIQDIVSLDTIKRFDKVFDRTGS